MARRPIRRKRGGWPRRPEPPDPLTETRALIASGRPMGLIAYVSSLIAALDPRDADPFARDAPRDGPTLTDLARAFAAADAPESTALLTLIAAMCGDADPAGEIRDELGRRGHRLPDWLAGLHATEVEGTLVTAHALGDGEHVMAGVRLPGGHGLTALVFVDHNMGGVARDGFVLEGGLRETAETVTAVSDQDTATRPLEPAEARARMEEAIAAGAITLPRFTSDTWPAARPAVEWICRMLPEGGTGYVRPEWTERELEALTQRFLRSPNGRGVDTPDGRDLLRSILWFGTDYGPGDPLRWSPSSVEILMLDWLPRKIIAEAGFLSLAPEVIAAFARFCHEERGVPAHLTADTLAMVGELTPEYLDIVASPRLQGPMAILGAMGAIAPDDPRHVTGGDDEWDFDAILRGGLRDAVGDAAALRALRTDPLPDEPFRWDGVPHDIRGAVEEVLTLTDGCCDALLDAECRTAARRYLAAVARDDPNVFRRRARAETAAAAVVWIIGMANHVVGRRGGITATAIARHLGLTAMPTQRATTLLEATGTRHRAGEDVHLGSPEYLTSHRRAEIIAMRNLLDEDD
ncbi:MAG: hypothetical protein IT200_13925 [Thermoleophilia bacterium]|nr:hypothetical protein [Thermoleophilia bacterium]